ALEELGGLERRQQPVADEGRGELLRLVGVAAGSLHLLEVGVEDLLLQHAALDDGFEECIDGGWERHRRTFRNSRAGSTPGIPARGGEPNARTGREGEGGASVRRKGRGGRSRPARISRPKNTF